MSRKYDREDRIIDRLEQENKKLKQEVRTLQKRVKRLNFGYRKYLDTDPVEKEDKKSVEIQQKKCYDCGGSYNLIIIHNRRFRMCDNCGKRGKTKII